MLLYSTLTGTECFYIYSVISCVVVQVDSSVHYALNSEGQMGVKELARIFSARGKEQALSIGSPKRSPVKSNKQQV